MTPETTCEAVYAATRALPLLRDNPSLGFEILMGPPRHRPLVAFIGYQPGEWKMTVAEARAGGFENKWPLENTYLDGEWRLAKRLRGMFGNEFVSKCVGLNAIFVRARSVSEYHRTVSRTDRRAVAKFCLEHVGRMLDAMEPQLVVVIGLSTLDLFGSSQPDLRNPIGRVLTRTGSVHGRDAIATLHLSGAQISREDVSSIAARIKGAIPAAV